MNAQANGAGKLAAEDSTLPTSDGGTVFAPKGTLLAISFMGLHMNRPSSYSAAGVSN